MGEQLERSHNRSMSAASDIPMRLAAMRDLAPAGFAAALHVRYQTPTYLFQTYPDAWIAEYSRDGLVLRDPTVAWGFANTGAVDWADLADPDGVLARAAAFGLRHGVTLSQWRGGSLSIASFARADRRLFAREVDALASLMAWLHDATGEARPLPPETREGLRRLSVAFTHP